MAKAIVACNRCGSAIPPGGKKGRKFCSAACYHDAQRRGEVRVGRAPFHVYPCSGCGKSVNRRPSEKRNGEVAINVYCSRSCYDVSRERRRPGCARCGSRVLVMSAKYCGWECRVLARKPEPSSCRNCGAMFTAIKPIARRDGMRLVATKAATCSPACHNAWIRNNPERKRKISEAFSRERHPGWQGGSHRDGFRGHEWAVLSESVRERAGRKCEHCGMTENEHLAKWGQRLQVNHKNPFHQSRRKAEANRIGNLEALCKPCHTRADWAWRKANPVQMVICWT